MNNNLPSSNSYIDVILAKNDRTKYKTVLCKYYDTSKKCMFGEKCQFAHGMHELRKVNIYIKKV